MISRVASVHFANSMLCMKSRKRRLYLGAYGKSLKLADEFYLDHVKEWPDGTSATSSD